MDDEPKVALTKNHVASYLYFCTLYFVVVGVLYLWGYWSTFNVNILEYLNLGDVLKLTAYPVVAALLLIVGGGAFGGLYLGPATTALIGRPSEKTVVTVRRYAQALFPLYVLATFLYAMLGPVEKWIALPMLLAAPIQVFAINSGFLSRLIPHENTRFLVLLVLVILPPSAYGNGILEANYVRTGVKFTYLLSDLAGEKVANDSTPLQRLRFIGHAGENLFLFDPTKEAVIIFKLESGKALVFKRYKLPSSETKVAPKSSSESTAPTKPAPKPNSTE